jgi:hypothetical protein
MEPVKLIKMYSNETYGKFCTGKYLSVYCVFQNYLKLRDANATELSHYSIVNLYEGRSRKIRRDLNYAKWDTQTAGLY